MPLPIFAHLRVLVPMRLPSMRLEFGLRSFHIAHTKRDMVHHARRMQIRNSLDVQHVLQPVGAVRNLHRDPVGAARLHSSLPVEMEAENIFVEVIFRGAVVHDETRVDETAGDRIAGRTLEPLETCFLNKLNFVSFRILCTEAAAAIF